MTITLLTTAPVENQREFIRRVFPNNQDHRIQFIVEPMLVNHNWQRQTVQFEVNKKFKDMFSGCDYVGYFIENQDLWSDKKIHVKPKVINYSYPLNCEVQMLTLDQHH